MTKVDFRQFQHLAKQFEHLSEADMQEFSAKVVKELATRLLAKVKERTPVGSPPERPEKDKRKIKVVGESGKGKTFLSAEEATWQQYWKGYSGGTLRSSWTIGDVTKEGNTYSVEVINPMHYASYVEKGHRQTPGRYVPALGKALKNGWVEGKFMLTISEQELEKDAERIVEQKLNKFIKEMLSRW